MTSVMAVATGAEPSAAVAVTALVVGAGLWVWMSLALAALFRKVGRAPWRAWVPVVNAWTLFEVAGMRGWWAAVLAGAGVVVGTGATLTGAALGAAALSASFGGDAGAAGPLLVAAVMVPVVLWLVVAVPALVLHVRMLVRIDRSFGLPGALAVLGVVCFPAWASVVGWGRSRPGAADGRSTDAVSTARGSATLSVEVPATPSAPLIPPLADFAPRPTAAPAFGHLPVFSEPSAPAAPAAPGAPGPRPAPVVAAGLPPVFAAASVAVPGQADAPPPAPASEERAGEAEDRTVAAPPRRAAWTLVVPGGAAVALTGDAAVLGRNPVAPPHAPGAQVVAVDDVTRTVSKTHALLTRTATGWAITDLASTNGVFLGAHPEGAHEVDGTAPVDGAFLLGDAVLSLRAGA